LSSKSRWPAVGPLSRAKSWSQHLMSRPAESKLTASVARGDGGRPASAKMPAYGKLDNIRSAWNVGAMFRTADAVGLAGLYLSGMTATPPRPDLEKTALGASLVVPWDYWQDSAAAVRHLQATGLAVIALEQVPGAVDYDRFDFPFPHCFVVGHEQEGVSPAVLAVADDAVQIPMTGSKDSLNVAVSFGILVYQVRRHWLANGSPQPTEIGQ